MLLSFDLAPEAVAEHDDWHTHEHLPERLALPGFIRGSRWVAIQGQPRYLVLYEVRELAVLASEPYQRRLNDPTPATSRIMTCYRGMSRGFCAVTGSFGLGVGPVGVLIRFKPPTAGVDRLRDWLVTEALPALPPLPGIGAAHLLEGAMTPPMTNEQRIRGSDAAVDWAIVVTGYREDAVARLAGAGPGALPLATQGATEVRYGTYRIDYLLTADELGVAAISP
jgi:hypothetical protein